MKKMLLNNIDTHELEKMRYNNNSSSYKLGLIAILCSLVAAFLALNSVAPSSVGTMVKILVNIAVLLFGFLACEKVKVYNLKYSYYMYVIAGVNLARIFWYPLTLLVNYSKFMGSINDSVASGSSFADAYDAAIKLDSAKKLGYTVLGKLNDSKDGIASTGYFFRSGTVRGWVIIAFLVVSIVCFLLSGYINQVKSKKLSAYLEGLKK